jgi:hypothetical protein
MALVKAAWTYGVVMPTEKRGLKRKGYVKHLNGCWTYEGALDGDGYGIITIHLGNRRNTTKGAHRYFWEKWIGPIKEGMQLDHKCRTRSCVNPKHLREVTHEKNVALAQPYRVKKTHCKRGHELRDGNLYVHPKGWRTCKTCHLARNRLRYHDESLRDAIRVVEKQLGTGPKRLRLPRKKQDTYGKGSN